jgi:hypothetical protein
MGPAQKNVGNGRNRSLHSLSQYSRRMPGRRIESGACADARSPLVKSLFQPPQKIH